LANDNEVWGAARFSSAGDRERVEALGVTTRVCDLASGEFDDIPTDFTVVLHLATFLGPGLDYDYAIRVNAEGTGLLLRHCRSARVALVMSTTGVYKPNPDPMHRFTETDPLGEAVAPHSPTYAISKITEEAVARYMARAENLPVVIARMNAAYGSNGGLPSYHLDWMAAGQSVIVRSDPCRYSPIHEEDIVGQLEGILSLASVPATIVNWGGDDAIGPHDWCPYMAELVGVECRIEVQPVPGSQSSVALDVSRRRAATGPCTVDWRDGMRRMVEARYPNGITAGPPITSRADRLRTSATANPAGRPND
jgi:nucleoside-diphosphate-sugar epimerase